MNDFDDYRHSGDPVSSLWMNGVKVWPRGLCPTLVASGTVGIPVGMSDDGTVLYTILAFDNFLHALTFPGLTEPGAPVDLAAVMTSLGFTGNTTVGTSTDDGYLYFVAEDSSANVRLFKCLPDGTGAVLLWTSPDVTPADFTSGPESIGWHPSDPDYIYLLYGVDGGTSNFSKFHRSTGAETVIDSYSGYAFDYRRSIGQWDGGFVFIVGSGFPTTGDLLVYDITANAFDSFAGTISGATTAPDGLTYWFDSGGAHAFTIGAGPTITDVTPPCDDPPLTYYYVATADRTTQIVYDDSDFWTFL